MKYHYQPISARKVRIELIPENQKEKIILLEQNEQTPNTNSQLEAFYQSGLDNYAKGAQLENLKFSQYPTVAIYSFALPQPIQQLGQQKLPF